MRNTTQPHYAIDRRYQNETGSRITDAPAYCQSLHLSVGYIRMSDIMRRRYGIRVALMDNHNTKSV